jgi:hypothetical protein
MSVDADPEDILKMPFMQRVVSPALSGIGHFFGRVAPGEIRTRVDKRIIHAGKPWNLNFFSLTRRAGFAGRRFIYSFQFIFPA